MVMLSEFFPSYRIVFQFLISLDIGSHWLHMYRYVFKLTVEGLSQMEISINTYYTSSTVSFIQRDAQDLDM
jgi:hypothetical protein